MWNQMCNSQSKITEQNPNKRHIVTKRCPKTLIGHHFFYWGFTLWFVVKNCTFSLTLSTTAQYRNRKKSTLEKKPCDYHFHFYSMYNQWLCFWWWKYSSQWLSQPPRKLGRLSSIMPGWIEWVVKFYKPHFSNIIMPKCGLKRV